MCTWGISLNVYRDFVQSIFIGRYMDMQPTLRMGKGATGKWAF